MWEQTPAGQTDTEQGREGTAGEGKRGEEGGGSGCYGEKYNIAAFNNTGKVLEARSDNGPLVWSPPQL